MGSYHSLLSSLVAYHQQGDMSETEQDLTFVKVLARVMGKKLEPARFGKSSPSNQPK